MPWSTSALLFLVVDFTNSEMNFFFFLNSTILLHYEMILLVSGIILVICCLLESFDANFFPFQVLL